MSLLVNRWYDAAVGRWISEDPIGFAGGDANLSRYVGNRSNSETDPSGLDWGAGSFSYPTVSPESVGFVANRVVFLGTPRVKDSHFGFLASHFEFNVKSIPKNFLDANGCKLCAQIGLVQIVKGTVDIDYPTINLVLASKIEAVGNHDWKLDKSVPYPAVPASIDPTAQRGSQGEGDSINFSDHPGVNAGNNGRWWGIGLDLYQQKFEIHVVCLAGKEQGRTYGGYDWGHTFTRLNRGNSDYSASNYGIIRYSNSREEPSDEFKRIVSAHLYK
jgi:hypothetical protein